MNDVTAPRDARLEASVVGQSTRRPALDRFTSGRGIYVADIALPGMLHVALARSPIAHGEILAIGTTAARSCEGVVAVITAADLHGVKPQPLLWNLPGQQYSKMRALADDRLRYVGQPYAAVVARTRMQAEQAAARISIQFKPLPLVLSVDAALAADAPRLYAHWNDNVVGRAKWRMGEPEQALATSATVVSESFVSQRVHALSLEPRGVLARIEPDGSLTLWTSTQSIHQVRASICECLDWPEHRLRVIAPDVGGSFGMKACPYGEETLVAFLAKQLGQPIRWIETRPEAFVGSVNGRDTRVELQVGFDPDGRITALKGRVVLDKGADPTPCAFGTAWTGGAILTSGYRVPAMDIEALGAMTNKTPTGAYRGYGHPESNLAIERTLDIAAERLGLTPTEIRRRNLVKPEEMPYQTLTGPTLDSGEYERLMDMTLEKFGYAERLARAAATRNAAVSIGVGFASYTELTNFGMSAACKFIGITNGGFDVSTVRMEPSGQVRLFISQTPMGQGVETALGQLCAQELGLSFEDVTVVHGDTMTAPYTAYGSGGSRGAGVGGASVVLATRDLAAQIRRWGAHLLQASDDQVDLASGGVEVRGEPERRVTISQIAAAAYFGAFCPPGMTPGLEARAAYDPPGTAVSYGTVAAEVELDRETGKIRVTALTFGHDCGPQINPEIVDGQVRGGVVQALGAALFEELRYDDEGRPLVTSTHDYFVPLASDVPAIDLLHLETPSPFSPHGVKGVGESGTIGVPAAIMNAVQNAIGPGVILTELPLRAERVLEAIRAAGGHPNEGARSDGEKCVSDVRDPTSLERALWPKTATASHPFPALDCELEADVAIVGGGYTGLSAALHLAKAGKRVALLEAYEPGYGASGRNAGGYLPFYLDRTPQGVRRLFGERAGEALNQMVAQSGRLMLELIARYRIQADVRTKALIVGGHDPGPKGRARMLDVSEQWRASGQAVDLIEREEMFESTGTHAFAHGLRFHDSGTLNPMSLARGLAQAASSEGANIFTRSAATALARRGSDWRVGTAHGAVFARDVLIATDGYAANTTLWPALERTLYRVPAAIVASRPSPELARLLSPRGLALADDYAASHLYMMFDSEDRLVASLLPPRNDQPSAAEVAHPFEVKLRRVFPHLKWSDLPRIEWEHFWLGTVALTATRVPCAMRLAPRLHSISGYSGQGITAAIGSGREYAQFICADGQEQSCRLPFIDPRPVPMRAAFPRLVRCAIAPLIRTMDRTYRR